MADMVPTWLSILGIGITAVLFLGATAVYLRGSKDKGTIDILNRHSAAQDVEIADLRAEVQKLQARETEREVRVRTLERENVALAAERPSRERLTELHELLTSFVAEAKQSDAEIKALLMAIAQIIEPKDQA